MRLNLVPVYLRDVTFKVEKVRDNSVKVVVATLRIHPLNYDVAKLIGVEGELFSAPNNPIDAIVKTELALGEGKKTHLVRLHATVDASTDPTFSTDDAFLGRTIKVRRDKEGPVFSGTFEVNFTYPEPRQLLAIANGINEQFWVEVGPTNPGLFEEADREAARDEKKRSKKAKGEDVIIGRETTDGVENATPITFPKNDDARPS